MKYINISHGHEHTKYKQVSLELVDANSCLEWINNKILMYSIGNHIQNPMINHMEKK